LNFQLNELFPAVTSPFCFCTAELHVTVHFKKIAHNDRPPQANKQPLQQQQQRCYNILIMMTLSSQQLASITKVQFRFADPKLAKYNADTLANFLFDFADPKGTSTLNDGTSIVTIPQDVMFRTRRTILSIMKFEALDLVELRLLTTWCDAFIFMNSRGKAIRHARHVMAAISEAVEAKETSLTFIIDSSACDLVTASTAATATSSPLPAVSTPIRRSPRTRGRPPLAPKNGSPVKEAESPNKKNTNSSPMTMADVLKKNLPLPLTPDAGPSKTKISTSPSSTMDFDHEDDDDTDMEPIPWSPTARDDSFNMDEMLEDCCGDLVILTEPEDSLLQMENNHPMEYESFYASPFKQEGIPEGYSKGANTHCFLLPSFFDAGSSLSATTTLTDCYLNDSSLFNDQERNMVALLHSVMEVCDETILQVTNCDSGM
jgi:hypothetical protein